MAASVAGKAEGVARVVRGVVERRRVGEAGAVDDEEPEGERERAPAIWRIGAVATTDVGEAYS